MCDILVDALIFAREHKGLRTLGWVILDNHFHAVLAALELGTVVAELKRFTAHRILERLREERREWLLDRFHVFKMAHKRASEHQVWQEGSHPQSIRGDEMMLQKLEYLHQNPVKRGLVAVPEHWRYSSAHEWLDGAQPLLRCDRWRE